MSSCPYVKHLDLAGNDLSDISFLAGVSGTHTLNLSNNNITDVSALADIEFEEGADIDLSDNQVTDIQPLIVNPGLGPGASVSISGNIDIPAEQIAALQANGVTVLF